MKSPGEITLTCYAACPDITKTITPDLKCPGVSELVYVDLNPGKNRLGGSALSTVYNQIGDEVPDMEDSSLLKKCFECVQKLLDMRLLLAGHDRSDGGLVVTLLEMAFAGNCGISVRLPAAASTYSDHISELFSEELGIVLEILPQNTSRVLELFSSSGLLAYNIGNVTEEKTVQIIVGNDLVINDSMTSLRDAWESTSFSLEMLQCNPSCVKQEQEGLSTRTGIPYRVVFDMNVISLFAPTPPMAISTSPRIAVLRQEGSNGDREMLSAFYAAGFEVWDVNMRDLIASKVTLDKFRGVVFCGGFSYADVNDSAKGWAGVIKFNPKLLDQFNAFRDREDSFSLGVCNGCQLMALLGWVPFPNATLPGSDAQFSESQQARFIHNSSGRYESRWVGIKIMPSAAVLLDGMAGSTLGVWVAHGEGKAYFPNEDHQRIVEENGLAPIRYVDDNNNVTEVYPMNPNGSPNGIAALCSPNGRHLAMMPHPERCFLQWQWPHMPQSWKVPTANSESLKASPWMKLFQNAFDFCNK